MLFSLVAQEQKLRGKVLLVEDDQDLGRFLKDRLERVGVKCHWETSLEAAKAAFDRDAFHALIVDMYLSESTTPDGLELVRYAEPSGVPVIVISSAADLKIAKEAMNHGAVFLIEKPFEVSALLETLAKTWEEPRGLRAMVERFLDLHDLTPKEKEVVTLLLKGLSNKEVASVGNNSDRTIKFHLTSVFEKCGVKSRTELFNAILPT